MKVLSYKYTTAGSEDRTAYMTPYYIGVMQEYLDGIQVRGKVAVLYAGGVTLSASEARNANGGNHTTTAIKEISAYSMHKWIGMLDGKENVCYASVNGNTCASSMYALYEAERLLLDGYDEVVVIAEEMTSYNTVRVFDEMHIDLKIGEGCAIIHLGKDGTDITECKWSYEYNRNPFGVTPSGYNKVVTDCDYIKPHGTGTPTNEEAEKVYGDKPQIRYKEDIGHTQGASGLIEVCKVLDENISGRVMCVSSGLGGFYGSCIIQK